MRPKWIPIVVSTLAITSLAACQSPTPEDQGEPHVIGGTEVERGRYLAIIGGCNDCHTDGYLPAEGDVPEDQWLLGSPLGWRGPWGTTYPPILRLSVQAVTEDQWVDLLHTRTALPPMPWMNINQVAESDLRVLYRYIVSLGAGGEVMPAALPPSVEPTTPYLSLAPVIPEG